MPRAATPAIDGLPSLFGLAADLEHERHVDLALSALLADNLVVDNAPETWAALAALRPVVAPLPSANSPVSMDREDSLRPSPAAWDDSTNDSRLGLAEHDVYFAALDNLNTSEDSHAALQSDVLLELS